MAARKPRIEYYWRPGKPGIDKHGGAVVDHFVDWRLVGANGEIMCFCNQGFRDKTDAKRSTMAVAGLFHGDVDQIKHVGPGKKPNA